MNTTLSPITAAAMAFETIGGAFEYLSHIESYRAQFKNTSKLSQFDTHIELNLRKALFETILGYVPKSVQFQIWYDAEGSDDEHKFGFLVYSDGGIARIKRFEATVTRVRNGEKVVEFDPTVILCKPL